MRCCLLSSTNASVARHVWANDDRFKECLALVIADRECGALQFAIDKGIHHVLIKETDSLSLSNQIIATLETHQIDYTFCFLTRLLKGAICHTAGDTIFNFHPSLLPACPGMRGFEESIRSTALFIGSTVHLINEMMDGGKIVMQSIVPAGPMNRDSRALRHSIFLHQCAQLLQLIIWLGARRFQVSPHSALVTGGDYSGLSLHCPALEDKRCLEMACGGAGMSRVLVP
jgi:phosphoribosylglycinamide formyltransferase-1